MQDITPTSDQSLLDYWITSNSIEEQQKLIEQESTRETITSVSIVVQINN
jgi:hypothetical protein